MNFVYPFFITFLFSAIATRVIVASGDTFRWLMQKPTGDRWHTRATPSFGGVAIFLAFAISFFAFGIHTFSNMGRVFLGGSVIFLLGLIDDIRPLPPYIKLVGQIGMACLMVLLGVHLTFSGHPLIYIPLTLLWIVGITNAFNLLDNMDGLAGGIALISTITLGFLFSHSSLPIPHELIGVFAGSIAGFLLFNVHPARVFMGDCGAQWMGFTLACLTILDTWKSASNLFILLVTPALILAVPIFDTTFVTLQRKFHGRKVAEGGKDHTSHRLVALGFGEQHTVWILWGLSIFLGLVAIVARFYNFQTSALLICGGLVLILTIGMLLTDVSVYRVPTNNPKQKRFRSLFFYSKRRFVEITIDTLLIGTSYSLAYMLRYDWTLDTYNLNLLAGTLPMVMGIKLIMLVVSGTYRGIWTYIDFDNSVRLFRSSMYASLATIAAIIAVNRFEGFSRTLFAIDFILLFIFMTGARALLRTFRESVLAFPEEGIRILVVGAGDASRNLLRDIRKHRDWGLRPVALLDDDKEKWNQKILGIPVIGSTQNLQKMAAEHQIHKIVICIPSASKDKKEELEKLAQESNLPWINIPSIPDLLLQD